MKRNINNVEYNCMYRNVFFKEKEIVFDWKKSFCGGGNIGKFLNLDKERFFRIIWGGRE